MHSPKKNLVAFIKQQHGTEALCSICGLLANIFSNTAAYPLSPHFIFDD